MSDWRGGRGEEEGKTDAGWMSQDIILRSGGGGGGGRLCS